MKKNKKWFITTGAGLGMIFGYAVWNAGAGLVMGAAIGLIIYASSKKQSQKRSPKFFTSLTTKKYRRDSSKEAVKRVKVKETLKDLVIYNC